MLAWCFEDLSKSIVPKKDMYPMKRLATAPMQPNRRQRRLVGGIGGDGIWTVDER